MTKKRSDEDKEEGLVTIPMLNIYKIAETKSEQKFMRTGETLSLCSPLKNYSGGSYPGVKRIRRKQKTAIE